MAAETRKEIQDINILTPLSYFSLSKSLRPREARPIVLESPSATEIMFSIRHVIIDENDGAGIGARHACFEHRIPDGDFAFDISKREIEIVAKIRQCNICVWFGSIESPEVALIYRICEGRKIDFAQINPMKITAHPRSFIGFCMKKLAAKGTNELALAVFGDRESDYPGIRIFTHHFLNVVFDLIKGEIE